jgi:hypothetical protein
MKKLLFATAILLGLNTSVHADGIDLKGIKLGMTEEEINLNLNGKKSCGGVENVISSIWGKCSSFMGQGTMTLVGVKVDKPYIQWDNEKSKNRKVFSVKWTMSYEQRYLLGNPNYPDGVVNSPEQWDIIKAGIKNKYPDLKCETYAVNNAFGAGWENEECTFAKDGNNLLMRKYEETLSRGFIQLYYKDIIEKQNDNTWATVKKDI